MALCSCNEKISLPALSWDVGQGERLLGTHFVPAILPTLSHLASTKPLYNLLGEETSRGSQNQRCMAELD